jgi:hypothetical protein
MSPAGAFTDWLKRGAETADMSTATNAAPA